VLGSTGGRFSWDATGKKAGASVQGSFALLLDLDGTIADTLPVCLSAVRATLARHTGKVRSDDEIMALFGYNELEVLQRSAPDCWQQCLPTYLQEYERAHDLCPAPFPGLVELLRSLRARGVRLGLVTGKGRDTLAISFRRLGLTSLFEEVRMGSPDPRDKARWIGEILSAFSVRGEHAAYLGDAPADIRASRSNGIRALAAAWSPTAKVEALIREHPDVLLRSVPELAWWVERWLGESEP